jgi:hypothetical protein
MSRTRKDRKEARNEARLKEREWITAANVRRQFRQTLDDIGDRPIEEVYKDQIGMLEEPKPHPKGCPCLLCLFTRRHREPPIIGG